MSTEKTPLEDTQELYDLLTLHELPEGYKMEDLPPKMTGNQAFSLIWFLQERLRCLPDRIEHCGNCGDIFDSWSENAEYVDALGKMLCESCYRAMGCYQCCKCEDHDLHNGPGRMAVLTQREGKLRPGLYRITRWPFYADGMIEGYLFESSFEKIGELPSKIETNGYPMGFLCQKCETGLDTVDAPLPPP